MAIVDLDRQQGFALIAEMTSTRNLLAYGIRVIRTGAFIDTTRDPILTMLSIGVEKLYKLTLGLIALDCDHKWPTKTEMQKQGHKLVAMRATVMNELRARTADKSEYVRGLLAEVDNDTVVLPIIEALDMYGRMGRFYYLDELGDAPQPVSPDDAWQNIEQAALADPAVATLYQQATSDVGDNDAWDKFIRALHERFVHYSTVTGRWLAQTVLRQDQSSMMATDEVADEDLQGRIVALGDRVTELLSGRVLSEELQGPDPRVVDLVGLNANPWDVGCDEGQAVQGGRSERVTAVVCEESSSGDAYLSALIDGTPFEGQIWQWPSESCAVDEGHLIDGEPTNLCLTVNDVRVALATQTPNPVMREFLDEAWVLNDRFGG